MNGWLTGSCADAIWSKNKPVTPMPVHSNSYSNERMYAWLAVMYYTLRLYSRRVNGVIMNRMIQDQSNMEMR